MTFNPSIPQPNNLLSNSQNDLLVNMTALDTVFGIDHYKFSDATANIGFHNTVTTPIIVGSAHPATAAAIPKLYAMQDSANLGVIQYSRGPNSAVPTPVTSLHSPAAAIVMSQNVAINIFDFTGLARAMCIFTAFGTNGASVAFNCSSVFWTGSVLKVNPMGISPFFVINIAGSVLTLTAVLAGSTSAYWTLEFLRTT